MSAPVLARALRDLARSLAWWALGLIGLSAMMVGVYPSVRDNPAVSSIADNYPEALQELFSFGGGFDYSSPAGYLGIAASLHATAAIPLFLIHEFYPQNVNRKGPVLTKMAFEMDADGYIGLPPGPGLLTGPSGEFTLLSRP